MSINVITPNYNNKILSRQKAVLSQKRLDNYTDAKSLFLSFKGNFSKNNYSEIVQNNSANVIFVAKNHKSTVSFHGIDVTNKNILVTGGAGYIGSITSKYLLEKGYDVIVIDNLSLGNEGAIKQLEQIAKDAGRKFKFYNVDIGDSSKVADILDSNRIDAVMHFAGFSRVDESIKDPEKYRINNTEKTIALLKEMAKAKIKKIVFSSAGEVYGTPVNFPFIETDIPIPTNPYGKSKLEIEKQLKTYDKEYGLRSISLRYFNVAGASSDGRLGECQSHLIPNILKVALEIIKGNNKAKFKIFGDGTSLRTFIHVEDLAKAHEQALHKLLLGGYSSVYNLGPKKDYTINELLAICEKIAGIKIPVEKQSSRTGDIARQLVSNEKAKIELGWEPKKTLEDIIKSHWIWTQNPKF